MDEDQSIDDIGAPLYALIPLTVLPDLDALEQELAQGNTLSIAS